MAFITLVRKLISQLFKCSHYSILGDNVHTHNFKVYYDDRQVQLLFKVQHLTQVNPVYTYDMQGSQVQGERTYISGTSNSTIECTSKIISTNRRWPKWINQI